MYPNIIDQRRVKYRILATRFLSILSFYFARDLRKRQARRVSEDGGHDEERSRLNKGDSITLSYHPNLICISKGT
jgi:hypothetical protein